MQNIQIDFIQAQLEFERYVKNEIDKLKEEDYVITHISADEIVMEIVMEIPKQVKKYQI